MQTVGAHCLDVSRPLIDQYDVEPSIREVGGDTTSVRPGAENCDFLVHYVHVEEMFTLKSLAATTCRRRHR